MARKLDVFDDLNKYLEKGDEDSFIYDLNSEDIDTSNQSKGSQNVVDELKPFTDKVVDLSYAECEPPLRASKRLTRSLSKNKSNEPIESLDLTNGSLDLSPPKRSRRAADGVGGTVQTIELAEESDNSNLNNGTAAVTRSRGRPKKNVASSQQPSIRTKAPIVKKAPTPKVPKAKKLTYKQAIALVTAPIPQAPSESRPLPKPQTNIQPSIVTRRSVSSFDIDLTGDVQLTDKHSKAPLFEKNVVPNHKEVSLTEQNLLDEDLDAIRVKVKRKDVIKAYPHRLQQRYYDLLKTISEKIGSPVGSIFLYDGDKRILPDDTPESTNYNITTILTCRVMSNEADALEFQQIDTKNQIEVKFQSDKWKKPISIKVSKLVDFKTAIEKLCEQVPFKPNQISLEFDGEDVALNQTPIDLDFDGGEILDCRVKP